jgi:adenosine deaminase
LALSKEELQILARNSFIASFASDSQKQKWLQMVDDYCEKQKHVA